MVSVMTDRQKDTNLTLSISQESGKVKVLCYHFPQVTQRELSGSLAYFWWQMVPPRAL